MVQLKRSWKGVVAGATAFFYQKPCPTFTLYSRPIPPCENAEHRRFECGARPVDMSKVEIC